ncbi:MAG: glycosyltransferase [Limnohabitans sp.]|nr:glycosyltransferase [Limnohabitans sp.]
MNNRTQTPPTISCVMPAYNEAANLPHVIPQTLNALRSLSSRIELIVVDDGSIDATTSVMKDMCAQFSEIVFLELSRNFGKENALSAGLDAAQGEVVILMDSDGQHSPTFLKQMFHQWKNGCDVVYAVRKKRDDQSKVHVKLTRIFYKLINWGGKFKIPENAGDFRLMDRKTVDALKKLPERNRFMKGLYAWVGFKSCAIDYEPCNRLDGKSNFGMSSSITLALTGMLAFSIVPLRALTWIGFSLSALAIAYGIWVIGEYSIWGINVPGYATIVVALMFFSGLQLLAVGILSEYVGRIYEEVKQRPNYLIRQQVGHGLGSSSGSSTFTN